MIDILDWILEEHPGGNSFEKQSKVQHYSHQTVLKETEGRSAWCACWPAFQSSAQPPLDPPHKDQTLRQTVEESN